MKRFFVVAAVVVMATGLCSQAAAAVCTSADGGSFCQFGAVGCYELTDEYSDGIKADGSKCAAGSCTCADVIRNCEANGSFYKGVTGLSADNKWGGTVTCTQQGGTQVGEKGPESCGGYCKWPTGCEAISTDPKGAYGDPIKTCAEAIANCQSNGLPSQVDDCSDVANVKVEYCYWGEGKCYPMNNPDGASEENPGMTNKEACAAYGHVSQLEDCSDVSSIKVEYCYWGSGTDDNGNIKCYPMNDPSGPSADNPGMTNKEACAAYGAVSEYADCHDVSSGGNAVRLLGSKAAAQNLKVSYAKNRVTVNWNAGSKLASGTVQLLNVKGVAVSTAFIKANSGKVSVKLGTVGVPAGMYFVHINAVGVNGKKIVTNSAVSIVK